MDSSKADSRGRKNFRIAVRELVGQSAVSGAEALHPHRLVVVGRAGSRLPVTLKTRFLLTVPAKTHMSAMLPMCRRSSFIVRAGG
jgi:hypothetical protein